MGDVADHFPKGGLGSLQLFIGAVELGRALLHQDLQICIDPLHLLMGLGITAREHNALTEEQKHIRHDAGDKHVTLKHGF